jgi:hypothetical protein
LPLGTSIAFEKGYAVESFNVSNLTGIKWRIIDIGKRLLFTFCKMFENTYFPFSILSLQKMLLCSKNIFREVFSFLCTFSWFFSYSFFRGISESRHQRI